MKKKDIICVAALSVLLTACYKDKGNYDYDESIADITVKLDQTYGIRKADTEMTYTIKPEIKTADGDKSYLRYTWVMNTQAANASKNDTIGHDESVTLTMDPNDAKFAYKYYIKLYVDNELTGARTMVPTTLEVTKPYSKAWAVLYEKDGHAELGTVEYVGSDVMITPNAYSQDAGKELTGKPVSLAVAQHELASYMEYYWAYTADSQFYINTTNEDESGLVNQADKFKLMATWRALLSPQQVDDADLTDFQTGGCSNCGLVMVSKGHAFNQCLYSPVFFEMKPDEQLVGDYEISKIAAGPHTAVGYDKVGHRFVHLALQSSDTWMGYNVSGIQTAAPICRIPYKNGLDSRDPNRIDPSENVISIINGYHYDMNPPAIWQRYQCYAYALAPGNMSHVYILRYYALTHTDVACLPYDYEFSTPEGINENTPMTSGPTFNNIIFYASGNKVYRLDVTTGASSVIYQNEDTKAEIVTLKMAMDGYSWSDDTDALGSDTYGHPYARTLGVAVNKSDGTGELVVLQLNTAGKVDDDHKFASTQTHRGFGKIKDIAFM